MLIRRRKNVQQIFALRQRRKRGASQSEEIHTFCSQPLPLSLALPIPTYSFHFFSYEHFGFLLFSPLTAASGCFSAEPLVWKPLGAIARGADSTMVTPKSQSGEFPINPPPFCGLSLYRRPPLAFRERSRANVSRDDLDL